MDLSRVKDGNFIVIQSFMVKTLKLKGNELLTYALIYGFSQDEQSRFTGSLQYIADWTNATKRSVQNTLSSLCDKGYIVKSDKVINNIKFCEYAVVSIEKISTLGKKEGVEKNSIPIEKIATPGIENFSSPGIENISTNNISKNINNKIENKIDIYSDVVGYLNKIAGTNFRASSKETQKHIKARLSEGFTLEDFQTVIDKKVAEWMGSEMEVYLRPSTLFGSKFEAYLNQKILKKGDTNYGTSRGNGKNDGSAYADILG